MNKQTSRWIYLTNVVISWHGGRTVGCEQWLLQRRFDLSRIGRRLTTVRRLMEAVDGAQTRRSALQRDDFTEIRSRHHVVDGASWTSTERSGYQNPRCYFSSVQDQRSVRRRRRTWNIGRCATRVRKMSRCWPSLQSLVANTVCG